MRRSCLIGLIVIALPVVVAAQGTTENAEFVSTSLNGKVIPVTTYLPEGYTTDGPPYPVYIFLHGAGGQTHSSNVQALVSELDPYISNGTIDPMVVVFPGFVGAAPGHEDLFLNIHCYRNSVRNGQFEDGVIVDLLDWLDTTSGYNISSDREERAIGGFSDGAVGSVYLAVKHSDMFKAFVAHSGHLALYDWEQWVDELLNETPSGPPYTFDPGNGGESLFWFGRATAFSPNMIDPNYPAQFVDFPVDSLGTLIPEVFEDQWIANHDPTTLIENPAVYTNQIHMYLACGTEDLNLDSNELFHQELTDAGVPHTYQTFSGSHQLKPVSVRRALRWLNSKFNAPPTDASEIASRHGRDFVLEANRPNPFDPVTEIPFSLSRGGNIDISVFNVRGQRVTRLAEGHHEAGSYSAVFDASRLPAGVYWYQLTVDGEHAARKMVVTR